MWRMLSYLNHFKADKKLEQTSDCFYKFSLFKILFSVCSYDAEMTVFVFFIGLEHINTSDFLSFNALLFYYLCVLGRR